MLKCDGIRAFESYPSMSIVACSGTYTEYMRSSRPRRSCSWVYSLDVGLKIALQERVSAPMKLGGAAHFPFIEYSVIIYRCC